MTALARLRQGGVHYLAYPPGTGFGQAAEAYITALRAASIPVTWTPLRWGSAGPLEQLTPSHDPPDTSWRHADICHLPLDCTTMLVHSPPLSDEAVGPLRRPGQQHVAYTTHETDRLASRQVEILERFDAVLVPSRHNRDVLAASGVGRPITIVPHVTSPDAGGSTGGWAELDAELFVFYVIGTWTARKALALTVTAFLDAFSGDDPVALVVKTTIEDRVALERRRRAPDAADGRGVGRAWWSLAQLLSGRRNPPRVHLATGALPAAAIDDLHARGDCFVSLSRGEAWNLPAFDAAAHGNPVVVTGWGGHLDFLPDGYPYLVDFELEPTTATEPDDWFELDGLQRWARPDVQHASELLRRVYLDRAEARAWGAAAQQVVGARCSPEVVLERLAAALAPGA